MDHNSLKLDISGLFPDFKSLTLHPQTPEELSALFVAILIGVATCFSVVSILGLLKAYIRTNWVTNLLKEETSQSVVKNRQEFRDRAGKIRHTAGHVWREFDETLVEVRVGEEIHLHNIYDASYFFNSSTLARGISESRMLAAVPGFLTALGVIGTFIGLQLGLSELNIGNDVAIQEMKEGLAHVISGAKIAFMTSVWGVTLSVLFNFLEKWLEGTAQSFVHRLQERIDDLFPRFSAEVQLQKIAVDGAESREALQGLAERIGDKMQETLLEATSGIQSGLEASLEKIMAPAIEKLVNQTTDGNQEALEKLVGQFLDKFGEQGDIQRNAMNEASKEVGNALDSMNKTLEGFIHDLDQNQQNAAQREQHLVEKISQQVDQLVKNSSEQGKLLAEVTKEQIEKITGKFEQSQKAQEERETQLTEKFGHAIAGMGKTIEQQTGASTSLVKQGKELQQQVEASQTNMDALAQELRQAATELGTAATQLKEYGDGVRDSSLTLGGAIQEAARSTASLASENQKSSTTAQQIQQQILSDIKLLKEVVSKLDLVVKTADSTFTHLEEHQQNYLQGLKENVEELEAQGTELLKNYAEQANAQTAHHLGIWAQHTTDYAVQMNGAVRALSTVVDEIEDKLGR